MPAIGIIDDRDSARQTLYRAIDRNIPRELKEAGWLVNESPPLPRLNDYSAWLAENDIAVLILDEKLTEQAKHGVGNVDYQGHNIVDFLRTRLPDFPIYIITAYPKDPAVIKRFKDVEGIENRKDFTQEAKKTVPRLIRAGQRYFDSFQQQLAEVSKISKRVALGKETDADIDRLRALHELLHMPYITDPNTERSRTLTDLEEKLDEFEELRKEIEAHLGKVKPKTTRK
jgi:hypothetical protein